MVFEATTAAVRPSMHEFLRRRVSRIAEHRVAFTVGWLNHPQGHARGRPPVCSVRMTGVSRLHQPPLRWSFDARGGFRDRGALYPFPITIGTTSIGCGWTARLRIFNRRRAAGSCRFRHGNYAVPLFSGFTRRRRFQDRVPPGNLFCKTA